ncbi:MAG: dihydroorotate dehydrogenase electron transfer subunit [Bacteroidetes bacterium]|nr:dihydroorotate dehydrogenase electron transfer subunit [Bacteroidota bacterium]
MTRQIRDVKVLNNREISKGVFILDLSTGLVDAAIEPGQFVQVKIEGSRETFLRRPFSVHDYDASTGILSLLVQVAGPGSLKLSGAGKGDSLNIVFPLGNSFTLPLNGERVLLVGGGCGVAPLLYLGKRIRKAGIEPQFLLGFRESRSVLETGEYELVGKVSITTEDGSMGEKGFVTQHSVLSVDSFDRIYCCGPEPMMKAVAAYALRTDTWCEVSLEHLMACGFGVCLCCVVDTTAGNLCTCTDGPVFNIKNLKW